MKQLMLRWTTRFLFGLEELGAAHAVEQLFDEWLSLNHAVSFSMCLPCDLPPETWWVPLAQANALVVRSSANPNWPALVVNFFNSPEANMIPLARVAADRLLKRQVFLTSEEV